LAVLVYGVENPSGKTLKQEPDAKKPPVQAVKGKFMLFFQRMRELSALTAGQ
jgi:hypothetical protein